MCRMCDQGEPHDNTDSLHDSPRGSRRDFLKASTATAAAAAGLNLFATRPAAAQGNSQSNSQDIDAPSDTGRPGRRAGGGIRRSGRLECLRLARR